MLANIGLVISGGMAKGAYQVGVLKALTEYIKPQNIKAISAASVGALNAYSFSCNKLLDMEKMWLAVNDKKEKVFIRSLMKSNVYLNFIDDLSQCTINSNKFYVPLFDYSSKKIEYLNLASIQDIYMNTVLKAATSFIPLCKPIQYCGKAYFDGAVLDNIPIFPLKYEPLDYIICIYFDRMNYIFEDNVFDKKILKIIVDGDDVFLSKSLWFTKKNTEEMLEIGYERADSIFKYLFSNGIDDVESILHYIRDMNNLYPKNQIRITGDVVINNLNHIVQKMIKRKEIY